MSEVWRPQYARWMYLLLAIFALIFYWVWSVMFNAWFDIGVYSVVAVCIGIGVLGYFIYKIEEKKKE